MRSRFCRRLARATLRHPDKVDGLLGGLEGKVDSLPRVLAELVVDMIKVPGKTRW